MCVNLLLERKDSTASTIVSNTADNEYWNHFKYSEMIYTFVNTSVFVYSIQCLPGIELY